MYRNIGKNGIKALLCGLLLLPVFSGCHTKITKPSYPTALRIGTWKIAADQELDLAALAGLAEKHRLDGISLQEANISNQADQDPYSYYVQEASGLAMLFKLEPSEVSETQLENAETGKSVQRALVEKDGLSIALYNTQLSEEDPALRHRQIAQLIDVVNADPTEYKIIAGNFNVNQHTAEYAMFRDDFEIVNGYHDLWYDTQHLSGEDAVTPVSVTDNLMCTKNMRITDIQRVEDERTGNDLLIAEFEVTGELDKEVTLSNKALGSPVSVTSINEEVSPYMLVDYDTKTPWVSDVANLQQITVELDRVYEISQINVLWGAVKAGSYTLFGSVDGLDYQPLAAVEKVLDTDVVDVKKQKAQFVRFELMGKKPSDQGYEIMEIQILVER